MTMMKTTIRMSLLLAVLPLAGCPALVEALEEDPPRVNAPWARDARAVQSPDTPDEETLTPMAEFGPASDRDTDDLCDLDHEEDLGRVLIDLQEGVFELEDQTTLKDALEVVLRGRGPHKTRLSLETSELRSLVIDGVKRVELRDLTVVAYEGGGIFLENCPNVLVENVHFAGSTYGLGVRASTGNRSH